jgi:hypothetical protein
MVSWCNKFDAANGKEGVHTICITFMAGTLVTLVTFRLASVRMSITGAPAMAGLVGAVPSQRRALKISVRTETHDPRNSKDKTALMRPVAAIAISNDESESEERGNLTAFLWLGLLDGRHQVTGDARQHHVSRVLRVAAILQRKDDSDKCSAWWGIGSDLAQLKDFAYANITVPGFGEVMDIGVAVVRAPWGMYSMYKIEKKR